MIEGHVVLVADSTSEAVPETGRAQHAALRAVADGSPQEQAERRYLAAINPLLAEAYDQGTMEVFVDVLTWTVARAIVGIDKLWVTGDIVRRIGYYTCRLVDSNNAQREANAAKQEGRLPN